MGSFTVSAGGSRRKLGSPPRPRRFLRHEIRPSLRLADRSAVPDREAGARRAAEAFGDSAAGMGLGKSACLPWQTRLKWSRSQFPPPNGAIASVSSAASSSSRSTLRRRARWSNDQEWNAWVDDQRSPASLIYESCRCGRPTTPSGSSPCSSLLLPSLLLPSLRLPTGRQRLGAPAGEDRAVLVEEAAHALDVVRCAHRLEAL